MYVQDVQAHAYKRPEKVTKSSPITPHSLSLEPKEFSWPGWKSESPSDPPFSAQLETGVGAFAVMPSMLCGFWNLNPDLHDWRTNLFNH